LIFPQGTISHYNRVMQLVGGEGDTTDFARLFLAPGVAHRAGGAGPQPDNPLGDLVNWVEHEKAPTTLNGVIRDPSTGCRYRDTADLHVPGHGRLQRP
jgi:Tannase and feruloyl esterase